MQREFKIFLPLLAENEEHNFFLLNWFEYLIFLSEQGSKYQSPERNEAILIGTVY